MQSEFDKKGLSFLTFFLAGCLVLVFSVKTLSSAAFNAYENSVMQFFQPSPTATAAGASTIPAGSPAISADSYMVADVDSDTVLASKNAETVRPIASLTKLMTALVATTDQPATNLNKEVMVSEQAAATYPDDNIQPGEEWHASDLLYPMLMESSNDAAETLADNFPAPAGTSGILIGRDAFLAAMNAEAGRLGMNSTHFDDPTGLSDDNVSSAADLFTLAGFIEKNQPNIFAITKMDNKNVEAIFDSGGTVKTIDYDFSTINLFGDDPDFLGGKIGYTPAAGETMIALFTLTSGPYRGHRVAIIVLGSVSREQDINTLLAWLQKK